MKICMHCQPAVKAGGSRLLEPDISCDYVIICRDFGTWNDSPRARHWLDWLNEKSFTTLFVDGNHSNFDRLYAMPISEWHNLYFRIGLGYVSQNVPITAKLKLRRFQLHYFLMRPCLCRAAVFVVVI